MMTIPVEMYEQFWLWGVYTKKDMKFLVDVNAISVEDYERIVGATFPPTQDEMLDDVFVGK